MLVCKGTAHPLALRGFKMVLGRDFFTTHVVRLVSSLMAVSWFNTVWADSYDQASPLLPAASLRAANVFRDVPLLPASIWVCDSVWGASVFDGGVQWGETERQETSDVLLCLACHQLHCECDHGFSSAEWHVLGVFPCGK
jgi:hypothetical protein